MTDTDTSPRPPRIWVDADACPGPVKEILFRAAERTQVQVTLVANQWLRTPGSRFVRAIQVQGGFDAADDAIAERLSVRDFMEELRGAGVQTGGPTAFGARDRQAFANQLDGWVARRKQAP